ncbi:MAG: Crp/Fnr family transcriptional regulator [Clostridiales bacterium]|nr:Crp/Fnr family transcriptional regulator [Clostridiales bacterium]
MELKEYFPMWEKLTSAQQARLLAASDKRHFERGQIVHNGLTDCTGLFLIRSGQLRAYTISEEGREITMYRLFERDICLFSASCIMRSIQFDIVIEAEKDTEAWLIPAETYKGVMEESAPLANYTNEIMASRFSDVMWLIDQIMWKSVDRRLANFLLEESALENTSRLNITHEVIGNHLGTAREVVTRMLRYFQNEGMVKLSRGTVELTDMDKLRNWNNK